MAGRARGELQPPIEVMLPRSRMVGRRPTRSFKPAAIFPMHISPVPHPTILGMHVVVPAELDFYFMARCGWAGPPL